MIDTATADLSIALFDDGALIAAHHARIGRGHAEALLPAIAALPDGGRAGAIWVSCGPGSFTGIRVGIAAARALAFAWGAHLRGYGTLALIATAVEGEAEVAVVTHGGHGEWFVQQPDGSVSSMTPQDAAGAVLVPHVCGDAAAELVALRGFGAAHAGEADARRALHLPQTALFADATPHYGRAPDAQPLAAQ